MTRIVKAADERRGEIIQAAQQLFYFEGYEQVSISQIIQKVGIAKGTFYHYFKSKEDLLDQIIEGIAHGVHARLEEIVANSSLNAVQKLNQYFDDAGHYKFEHKEAVIAASKALQLPENVLLRDKLTRIIIKREIPLLTAIVHQGVKEGLFTTAYPQHIINMLMGMGLFIKDEFADILLRGDFTRNDVDYLYELYSMYQDSIEKVLGAPEGSIKFITREIIECFLI